MNHRLNRIMLFVILITGIMARSVSASETTTTVNIPYSHYWYTDVPGADGTFQYLFSAKSSDAPLPEGSDQNGYIWTIDGNSGVQGKEGKFSTWTITDALTLKFPFTEPGTYEYEVSAYVPKPITGYTYENRTFTMTLSIDEKLEVAYMVISGNDGQKYDRLDLDPNYRSENLPEIRRPDDRNHPDTGNESAHPDTQRNDSSASDRPAQAAFESDGGVGRTGSNTRTGDYTIIGLYAGIGVLAIGSMVLIFIWKKKEEENA